MAVQLIKIFIEQQKGKYPDRIIFYRDGVAESQFDQVCRDEIAALKRCCRKLDSKYDPKIVYIICGKRHHIRKVHFSSILICRIGQAKLTHFEQECTPSDRKEIARGIVTPQL